MNDPMIQLAKEVATKAHEGQFRKDGKPYITHPEAVAEIISKLTHKRFCFYDSERIQSAWLHDVLEDTTVTEQDLRDHGFSEYVISTVIAVTKLDGENYFDFIQRIKDSTDSAIFVKIADLKHNMSDLKEGSLKDKYRFALHMLTDYLKPESINLDETNA